MKERRLAAVCLGDGGCEIEPAREFEGEVLSVPMVLNVPRVFKALEGVEDSGDKEERAAGVEVEMGVGSE